MFRNPIREAGLGGFLWRDQTILEELKASKKASGKSFLFRYCVYTLTALATIGLLYMTGGLYAPMIATALVALVRFGRLDRMIPQGQVLYGIASLAPAIFFTGPAALSSMLGLVLAVLLVEGEVLLVASMLIGVLGVLPAPFNFMLPVLVAVAWAAYGFKTNHLAPWLFFISQGKRSAVEEPIRMPLGFHKAGTAALKKALRTNNGQVSARHRGSIAERVTAQTLRNLPAGSFVFHDIDLPGADDANIDHLAVTPHGVFVIDTKLFAGEIEQRADGSIVKKSQHGEQPLDRITTQMQWARTAIEASLHNLAEAKAIVAIQRAAMPGMIVAKDKKRGNVAYVSLENCVSTVLKFPVVLDENQMKEIAQELKPIVGTRKPVYAKK